MANKQVLKNLFKKSEKENIQETQTDYRYNELTAKALKIHFKCIFATVIVSLIIEILYYFVLSYQNLLYSSQIEYLIKFICIPFVINSALVLINKIVMTKRSVSLKSKACLLSLSTVIIGFVLAIVHTIFPSVYIVFDIAIILTVFYGDRIIVSSTFLLAFIGRIVITFISIDGSVTKGRYHYTDAIIALVILIFLYAISLSIISLEKEKQKIIVRNKKDWEKLKLHTKVDNLTKLMNRKALSDDFKSIYNRESKVPSYFAILDIDNFKEMNDTYGHLHGDNILRYIGQIFLEKEKMTFFRYGGDEFCTFIYIDSLSEALASIKSIQERAQNCVDDSGITLPIGLSVGITRYKDCSLKPETVFSQADFALYHSKKTQKGSISVFSEIDTTEYKESLTLNKM